MKEKIKRLFAPVIDYYRDLRPSTVRDVTRRCSARMRRSSAERTCGSCFIRSPIAPSAKTAATGGAMTLEFGR